MNTMKKAAALLCLTLAFSLPCGMAVAEGPAHSVPQESSQAENRVTTLEGAAAVHHYKKALQIATDLVELYPEKPSVYVDRSNIYGLMKKYDLSLADASKAIELSPADPSLYVNRALIYYHIKKYDLSNQDFRQALSMNPQFAGERAVIYTGLSYNASGLGKYDEAIGFSRLAQGQNPFDIETFKSEARVYELQGKKSEAQKVVSKGMAYAAARQGNFLTAGICAQQAGNMEEALEFLNRAEKQDKDNPEIYSARGLIYALTGQPEKGIEDLTKALKKREHSMDYNNRGECWRDLKQYDKAKEDYDKSVSLAKTKADFHAVYDSIGQMYMNTGNYKDAEVYFTKSLEQEEYKEGYEFRARVRRVMGKEKAAKRDEEKAAKFKE